MASCEAIPRLERPLPVGNGAELIKRRPDIRQAERQLAASPSQIGIETAALYPTVTFGAGLGLPSRMGSNEFDSSAIHYTELGRASFLYRVFQYFSLSFFPVSFKKKFFFN